MNATRYLLAFALLLAVVSADSKFPIVDYSSSPWVVTLTDTYYDQAAMTTLFEYTITPRTGVPAADLSHWTINPFCPQAELVNKDEWSYGLDTHTDMTGYRSQFGHESTASATVFVLEFEGMVPITDGIVFAVKGNGEYAKSTIRGPNCAVSSVVYPQVPAPDDTSDIYCTDSRVSGPALPPDTTEPPRTYTFVGDETTSERCQHYKNVDRTIQVTDGELVTRYTYQANLRDEIGPDFVSVAGDSPNECAGDRAFILANLPDNHTTTANDQCSGDVDDEHMELCEEIRFDDECPVKILITRTWTAQDDCGNSKCHTQTISYDDTKAPILSNKPGDVEVECPTNWTNAAQVAQYQAAIQQPVITASDDCMTTKPKVNLTKKRIDGECKNTWTLQRTWTVEDECGNSDDHTQYLTVFDETPPVWETNGLPTTVNKQCDEDLSPVWDVTAVDGCSGQTYDTPYTESESGSNPEKCPQDRTIKFTYTTCDDCGNTADDLIRFIKVGDDSPPTWNEDVPAIFGSNLNSDPSLEVYQLDDVSCDDIPTRPQFTANDTCDTATVTSPFDTDDAGPRCTNDRVIIWHYKACDSCDNCIERYIHVNVVDNIDPVIDMTTVPDDDFNVECKTLTPLENINVQTLDDGTSCIEKDDATVTPSQSPRFDEMCLYNYTVTRTWTAQDNCGNTDPVTRTFVVRDNNPPDIIGVPPHTSAYCNAPPASTDVYATDGCSDSTYLDSQLVMTPTGTRPTSGCINYTQTYTWDVQDHCEHKDSDHQDIEVYDNVDPYFIEELFPKDVSVRCDKFADVSTAKPPAGDGCAGVLSVSDHTDTVVAGPAATCKYNRTIERSWTVTDECLNTFTREQTITVFDNKKPDLIGVPENDRVPCHAVPCPPAVTAEDNCNDVKISFKEERVDNVDPDCVDTYTLLRTWTATDACGLEFSKTQVLEVFDEEDPWFFTEPENITELCTGTPPLPDIMTDQGRDLCDKNVEVTGPAVDPSETCHGNKTILYTWTAHDNCGGTKDYVQRITIYDNVGPYWRPAELDDETAECGVDIVPEWPNVGDECTNQDIDYVKDDPDHLDITEVPGSRTCVGNYSLDYTWTATDHCGNPSSITQRFNVYDTKKPIFTNCPGDVIVDCSEIPDVPPVNATDPHSCDNDVDVTYLGETPSTPDSECAHSYTLTREWLAEDDCGHTEMCTQVITVEDQHDPEILGVPETDDNVKCDDVPPPPPVCVHDNCNGVDMWFAESKDTECTGTYNLTRTWTAEDTCGRPAEVKSYVVHVVDDIDPEWNDDLEPPASREYECGDYTEPPKPEGTDTCGGASSVETGRTGENDVLDPNNFPNCNERDITLTWTLTDDCSNSVPRSHVLNVRDNRQPSINFIPALQAEVTDTCTVPTPPTPSSATDDCGISNTPQRTHSDDTTSCPYIFNRTYSWNVNDDCGLAAPTKTQKLIMEDPGLPSWDNEADNNEEDWYVCDTIVPDDTPTATDACGANITPINGPNTLGGFDANASGCRQNFTETRRWTATDVCANDLTWNQILHFYDVVAPTFDARDEPLQPLHNQCSQQNVPDLNSTDNCQTARTTVVALSHEQTNILCPYRYTVEHKYEAEDECSNTRQTTEPQVYTWDAEPSITVGGVSIDQLPAFQSKTVQCDSIPDLPDTVGQDACGVTLTVTDTDYVPVNADECNYELKRTWSVEDACGVPWSHTQTLTVVDSIAPALHGVPLSTTAECGFVPPAANVTATDSCPGVKLVMTEHRVGWTPENCCDYTLVRTWTATDKCSGLETVESQDIIVSDTNPPEIHNVPEDVTLECLDDGVPGWPTDPEVTAEEAPLGRGHCIDEDIASSSCTPAGTSPPNTATIDGAAFYFTNDAHVITWINGVAFIAGDLTDGTTTYSVNFQLSGKVLANSTSVTDAANLGLNDDCYVANNGDAPVNPNDWKAYTILQGNLTDSSETVHDATMTSEVALIGTGANNYNDGPGARIEFTFDGKAGAFVLQLSDDCDGAWRLYPTLACGPEVTLETDEEIIAYHGCDGRYDILRTWTATDRSDEVTTLTQLIRMRDRVGPKWVQATVPPLNSPATQAEYGCEYPQPGDPQLYDECSNSTEMRTGPTQSPVGETCAHRGSRTYTWGGKDDCNNTAEPVSQTLHRWDGLAPTPTVVPPFVEGSTVERQCTLPPLPSVSWQDNCASPLAVETHNDGDLNPTNTNSCPYHFDVTRSWTAEDVCGNDRTIEYDIEVRDTNPPIKPANPPTSYKVECTSHGFYPADDNDMVFTDECSGVLAPVSHSDTDNRGDPGTCEGGYEVTRTWTATDECNLSTPHTITVTVEDLAKPWINVDHLTAPCDDIPTPEETRVNVTFGDSCDPNPTLVWVEDEDSREPDSCAYDYKILRTWKVTDDCGKENTAVQEITIYDDEAPVLSPRPQNTRMPCDDVQCPELVKANDNCKGVYIAFKEERDDSFGCANEYLLTRTWTATDLCSGKKDEVVQTIEVYDEENPRFTTDPLPQSQIGYECRDVNIDIMPNVEGEDDCGFDQVYTADPHTPPACENFTFIRTWNATDLCGLHVVHTQEVTVKDTGKPYFLDEPAAWYDQLYECAPEATNDPNANDACGSASVTGPTDSPKDNEFCKYNYTFVRTWTATDNCLHTETETQNVRVHDPTAPYEVNPLPVHTVKCDELVAPTVPTYGVHFDDNCSKDAGEFTVTPQFTHNGDVDDGNRENSDPDCPHDYVLRRPWVITDACGHKLHIEEVMSVYDAYDPVLDFKPTEDFAQCHQLWDQQTIGASDTCTESLTVVPDAVNVTNSPAGVPECPGNYDLLRSWYVEDCSGRSDSHNQPIAVRDTLKPWWVESTKPQSRTATCKENVPYQEPMALDECDPDVDVNYEGASFAQHPNYLGLQACFDNRHSFIETRKWNANDDCQNGPIYHTQTITVVDDERPTIIPPADFEDELTVECGEVPDKPEMDIDDNCDDDITIVFNQTNSTTGDCPNERTIIRRWNAKDDCGNEAIEITQIIHVVDTTPPNVDEFSVPPPGRFRCNDLPGEDDFIIETEPPGDCEGQLLPAVGNGDNTCEATSVHGIFFANGFSSNATQRGPLGELVFTASTVYQVYSTDQEDQKLVFRGEAVGVDDASIRFDFSATFSGHVPAGELPCHGDYADVVPDSGAVFACPQYSAGFGSMQSPYRELAASCYDGSSGYPTARWEYYAHYDEVEMKGVPGTPFEHVHLSMSMRGPAVQVGIGANGKNGNMGMASWYVVTVLSDDDELLPDEFNTSVGDFNVDLGICDDLITPESFPCEDSFNVSHEDTTHNVMCSGNYTLRRTWTLKDCTGNPSNKSVDFDIFDDIKPVISGLPSNSDAPHRCNSTYTPPAGSCSDHCDPNPLLTGPLLIDTQHSCDGSFDRTYRWTCTDDCGNVKTEDRIIHFVDDDDPYFVNLPDGEEPYTEQYTCDEDFSDGKDRFTPGDVCSSVTSDYEESDPFDKTCEHNYTLTRTWTVTDDCNNEDDLVITVTITDPDPPSIFTGSPTCRPATLTEPQYVFEGANVNRETLDNPDHLFRATDLCSSRDEIDIIITGCYSDQDDFFDMDQSQRYIDTGGNFNDHCYYEEDSNGVGRLIIAPIADYDNDLGRMYYVTAHARDDCLLESEPITREILVPTSSLSFSLRNLPTTDECLYFTNCDEQCPHPCHYDVPLCKSVPVGDMPFSVISNGLTGNELSFDIQANGGFTGAMTRFTVDVDETVVEVTGQSPDVDIPALWKHLGAHAESYIGGVNWIATDGGAASVTVTGDYETTDVPAELAWDTADDEHLCAAFEVTALGARTDATTFQHISGKVGIVGTLINDPGDHAEIISPIAGAVVQLMQDGTPLRTVSTASDGSYTFRNVPAGSGYQVGVIKEGIFYEVELGIHRYVTGEARDHAAIWCYGEPKDVSPGSSANFGIFLDTAKWDRDRDRARYFEQYVTAAGQVRHSTTGRSKGTSTSFNGNSKPAGFWARQIALSDDGKAHLMSINDLVLKKAVAAAESVLTNSAGTFVCTGVRALLAGTNGHAKEVTSLLLNELTGYGVFQPYRGLQRIVLDLALNEDCSNPTAETKNMVKKMNRAD